MWGNQHGGSWRLRNSVCMSCRPCAKSWPSQGLLEVIRIVKKPDIANPYCMIGLSCCSICNMAQYLWVTDRYDDMVEYHYQYVHSDEVYPFLSLIFLLYAPNVSWWLSCKSHIVFPFFPFDSRNHGSLQRKMIKFYAANRYIKET